MKIRLIIGIAGIAILTLSLISKILLVESQRKLIVKLEARQKVTEETVQLQDALIKGLKKQITITQETLRLREETVALMLPMIRKSAAPQVQPPVTERPLLSR